MPDANFYEEVVRRAVSDISTIVEKATPAVMGGKNPPFKRQLTGRQLVDYYRDAPIDEKQKLWPTLSAEEQEMLKGAYGAGGMG